MKLSQLIYPEDILCMAGAIARQRNPRVKGIYYRSGDVCSGGMFVAMKGLRADGHQYIADALEKGASVIVADIGTDVDTAAAADAGAVVVFVKDTRKCLATAASRFYKNPSETLFVIGITGTNGKTTTAYLIEHLLLSNGIDTGVISTINYRYQGKVFPNPLTTPESLDLQKILAEMASAGVRHVVMEVSSHAVVMDRIAGCAFDMGIYTNLSQDHLDFHGTMAVYGACKRQFFTGHLFKGVKKYRAVAVINVDDPQGAAIAHELREYPILCVSMDPEKKEIHDADPNMIIQAQNVVFDEQGMNGTLRFPDAVVPFHSRLIGRYNMENILCAAAAASLLKMGPAAVADAIATFTHVPGRLERIVDLCGRHVFVDYAHTPEALENVLKTLREVSSFRLICVFGCGGDRDRTKRPKMGAIAVRLSDFTVITSDNPRTEDPYAIISGIVKGAAAAGGVECPVSDSTADPDARMPEKGFAVVPDRRQAIETGIRIAGPGDMVLIAGKGHEDYQIIGTETLYFDDREIARTVLAQLCQT